MVTTDSGQSLPDLLRRVERRVTGRLAALLAVEGSTLDEWRVLSFLARAGGRPMSAIAEATMLLPPTLTKRVDHMVADGLVHRRVDPGDRRRVLVMLSPRGRAAHDRLAPLVAQEEAHIATVATVAAGPDAARLTGMLADLLRALEQGALPGSAMPEGVAGPDPSPVGEPRR
jgi:MarR family transcriptional regulator, organic hydroperoxide resistance regulator